MKEELKEKEFSSLRDELLKWQDRRITFSQITITLVTVYVGLMLKDVKTEETNLSWQIVSLFPLLILSITMHINKIFEMFQLRIAAFLVVFHGSIWESKISHVSLSAGWLRIGYNKSMAIVYVLIASISTFVLYSKYPSSIQAWENVIFGVIVSIFIVMTILLYNFGTNNERSKMVKKWENANSKE